MTKLSGIYPSTDSHKRLQGCGEPDGSVHAARFLLDNTMSTNMGESSMLNEYQLFDSHLHIIDARYPLVANSGYIPDSFTANDYLARMSSYNLCGGAIVSGSFQAFDQSYLIAALQTLGPSYVGVTQLPSSVSDAKILELDRLGVRAVRFNIKRGGSERVRHLSSMASRVYEIAGWHVELYMDSSDIPDLFDTLVGLPAVSIDHLGLKKAEFKKLIQLAEKGAKVKATGFGRVDFSVPEALRDLYSANPGSLMFGTDLPSTRASRVYTDNDFTLVAEVLGPEAADNVFSSNALNFYMKKMANRSRQRETGERD
jgi:predicted TIM-barrel fold metal-dependent hydrolase